ALPRGCPLPRSRPRRGADPDRDYPAADGPHPAAGARGGVAEDGDAYGDGPGDAAATAPARDPPPGTPRRLHRREAAGPGSGRGRGSISRPSRERRGHIPPAAPPPSRAASRPRPRNRTGGGAAP